ncbi:NlpC/P60 family protein [candidate division KSB1 bacterium]
MEFGICNLSVIPVRSDPYEQSEMITQVLFGELLLVEEKHKKWCRIKLVEDGYEGWISKLQYKEIPETTFKILANSSPAICYELVQLLINKSDNLLIPIIIGSSLPGLKDGSFSINETTFNFLGEVKISENIKPESIRDEIVSTAKLYLNSPYLWGGKTPFGIDCSGFTQIIYKINGIHIQRDSSQQASQGETINFLSEARKGDLVYFDNEEGEIIHTGILIDDNQIIHASGKVRIDQIDHEGIYNHSLGSYTHKLRLIKKLL